MTSISTRVVVAVLVVITTFAAALAYNATAQRALVARLARINQGYVPIGRLLGDAREELRLLGHAVSQPDPVVLRQSLRVSLSVFPFDDRVDAHLDALQQHLDAMLLERLEPDERAFMSNLKTVVAQLEGDVAAQAEAAGALLAGLEATPPAAEPHLTALVARLLAFERRLDDIRAIVDARTDGAVADVREAEREILRRVIAVSAGASLLALVMALIIARSVAPIRALTALATRYRQGDYGEARVQAGNDEVGVLAREFAAMADAIRGRDGQLREQNQALEAAYDAVVEAQRAQVAAERLAAVGDIAARVTHELRNPLSSIGLNAEMLGDELDRLGVGGETREMVASIDHEVARLTELTERYLSLTKADDPLRESTDLVVLVGDVVRRMRPELQAAGVVCRVAGDVSLPCEVDPPQVRQVVINLVQNAVQALAGASNAEVRITVARDGDGAPTVAIEDAGPGVDDEVAATLFEPFVTTRRRGTGLGLSISRRIARRHGGDIVVGRSEALGGARFDVRLG